MTKVALITGITGQDGSYLAELLLSKGYEVHGVKRRASSFNTQRLDHLSQDKILSDKLTLHYGDLTDGLSLMRIIKKCAPNEIYNLGAQSHVAVSFETPEYTANADALGTLRILEAIKTLGLENETRFYQASTSEMFGLSNGSSLNEESTFHPRSPYGVAKLYAHWITINFREAYSLFASTGILFNHESPRRGETFVTRKIVRAAVAQSLGDKQTLLLGNLDAVRDWGHAIDYVRGMWQIMQHSHPDDWVLATGISMSVREFLEKTYSTLGIQITWEGQGDSEIGVDQNGVTRIAIDVRYYRPSEVPHLLGDSTKAQRELGWKPRIDITELIREMIDSEIMVNYSTRSLKKSVN